MVETISPVVHGGRTKTYWASLLLHVIATTATAAAFGVMLGLIGEILRAPDTPALWILIGVATLYAARELFALPIPVPQLKRQVPDWWRTFYSRPVAALLYGVGLGVGYFTYLTYGTFAVVTIGAIASGDPATGALIVGPFGLARSLALVGTGRDEADRAGALLDKLDSLATSRRPRLVNSLVLLCVAVAAATAL
ncbi:MAG: hypothetical protein QOG54_2194 [Actinomycetota bacterium]|jgi:hypothetical protein|nr:hypothetical protein [Actinomycetota bacterium]